MTNLDNFAKYIESISYDLSPKLQTVYDEAVSEHVPVIRKASLDLLMVLIKMKRPEKILEFGTAVGFSGAFMLENAPDNSHLTTVERNDKRIAKAKYNFDRLDIKDKVTLIEGDALEAAKMLAQGKAMNRNGDYLSDTLCPDHDMPAQKFDFIFLDSAKSSYLALLPNILELMDKGAVLVTDNILQNGELLMPRSLIGQRDRTTYDRMRRFVYELYHTDCLTTTIVPSGDGVAISVMNK